MNYPKVFAIRNIDKKVLKASSSGGVFFAIATHFITSLKGVVYGCSFANGIAKHIAVDSVNNLHSLMGTKYVKSFTENSFTSCANHLLDGRFVLYVGAPCQIVALKKYLSFKGVSQDRLFTLDFVCHGAPSQKVFNSYASEMNFDFTKNNYSFRNKKSGWQRFSVSCGSYVVPNICDPYYFLFSKNYILDEVCYQCPFKGENRDSDATMGDFWKIEECYPNLYNKNGVSIFVLRNNKFGIIDVLKKTCFIQEVDYGISLRRNKSYFLSSIKPFDWENIQNSILKKGFKRTCLDLAGYSQFVKASIFRKIARKYLYLLLPDNGHVYGKEFKSKRRIGVITDYGYVNFGNRLQNYALLKKIKEKGFSANNIYYDSRGKHRILSIPLKFYRLSRERKLFGRKYAQKAKLIKKACKKYEGKSFCFSLSKRQKKVLLNYSSLVIGSDQVWNYKYHHDIDFTLGNFQINSYKGNLVSYGASLSNSSIDEEFVPLFCESLSHFNAISLREDSGVEVIKSLGHNSSLVLDPTLLLSNDEWISDIKKFKTVKRIPEHYALLYFLSNNKKIVEEYKSKAASDSLTIIDLSDQNDDFYKINHFDFLELIKNADSVYTDSFHCCVFSLMFGIKTLVFDRVGENGVVKMGERIRSLFKILGLNETNIGVKLVQIQKDSFQRRINQLKEFSINYLNSNLK